MVTHEKKKKEYIGYTFGHMSPASFRFMSYRRLITLNTDQSTAVIVLINAKK